MLFKLRCPHTDVINFFAAADPAIAIGSIVQVTPSQFVWRSYLQRQCGSTRRLAVAVARLNRALRTTA